MEEQIKDLDNLICAKTIFLNEKQRALDEAQHEFEDASDEGKVIYNCKFLSIFILNLTLYTNYFIIFKI